MAFENFVIGKLSLSGLRHIKSQRSGKPAGCPTKRAQMKWEVKGKEKNDSNSTEESVKQQRSATAFKKAA